MKTALIVSWLALLPGCGGGGSSSTGVVPPDMRDVERAGEGLVSASFGAAPERAPDWTRVTQVLGFLKTVWGRAKAASSNLPAAQVMAVDAAIARIDVAIGAKNQKDAAYAANAVGLAVPELFDAFHPDAPKEVVRMDAVFRQIGLDAHFGDWTAAAADLASLSADWNNMKSAVTTRYPTCHRVGGTATVSGEIDASLAALQAAVPAKNGEAGELESDNGALEIDTLELLFDCPPDNVVPAHGPGSRCATKGDCDPGEVCDTGNGGKCAPDPATAAIGVPCMTTTDCGTDARSACNTPGDGFPGGYCSMEPCDDILVCPPGASCLSLGAETPACFLSCASDADCRTAEGYVCQLFVTLPPYGFGPAAMGCAFKCARDSDCVPARCDADPACPHNTCDIASGKCRP